MIWHGLLLIVSVATVLTVVAFLSKEYYKKIATSGGSLIMWLGAAAGSPSISYAYTKIYENTADNSYQIVKGTHVVEGPVSWLAWAWLGMAILMGLYLWYSTTAQAQKEMKGVTTVSKPRGSD